jgi:alanine racemase
MRPAWIEVDLGAIEENIRAISRFVGPTTAVMAVVKANAYGHGLVPVARAALAGGATTLGVAILDEALALRDAGVDAPILILGCGLPEHAPEIVERRISQVVTNREMAGALSREAVRRGIPALVHVKIDTGMGRVGVMWQEAVDLIREIAGFPGLVIDGLLTHFPTADEPDRRFTDEQLSRFDRLLRQLARLNIRPRWRHAANSAAIAFIPESHYDIVRPGLITYGIPPTPAPCALPLRPALSLKARLTQIKTVKAGEGISYGRTWVTSRRSRLAIVPLGYADGFSRRHSNTGRVLIRCEAVPIVGRVCMDQFVVDVTDVAGVELGDEVVVIGRQGECEIAAWDVATSMDSIPNEVLSALGERLPRVFI